MQLSTDARRRDSVEGLGRGLDRRANRAGRPRPAHVQSSGFRRRGEAVVLTVTDTLMERDELEADAMREHGAMGA